MKDKLRAAAKEFFIDTWLEFNSDQIIDVLQKLMAGVTPDNLKQFVAENVALPVPPGALDALRGYEDYVEKLTPQELFEWLYKARQDLGETLMALGEDATVDYLIKLRGYIIDSIKNPEDIPVEGKQPLVELTCDACGKKWTLPKDLAEQIQVCPFCGHSAKEETTEEPEEE